MLASVGSDLLAAPVGTAFTYQGLLNSAGQPASGNYDLKFTLYDAASGGGQVGSPVTSAPVIVTNGNFTVLLDFGAAFNGQARWLEIGYGLTAAAVHTAHSPPPTAHALALCALYAQRRIGGDGDDRGRRHQLYRQS